MTRSEQIARLKKGDKYDIVVIGGGASGLGVALDAVSRGLSVCLVEQRDYGFGTSSRSTKLVHGGVRYLEQGNLRLVIEALKERGYLLKQAEGNTHIQPFVVPFYRWWEGLYYYTGLKVYDWLSGKWSLGPSKWLSRTTVITKLPNVNQKGLKGGIQYMDGQFDDSRLCIDLVKTIVKKGATAINYMSVSALLKEEGRVVGVEALDLLSNETYQIQAEVVVNATGVFTDSILSLDQEQDKSTIVPSRGSHIVLDGSFLSGNEGIMIPKTDDGRVLFVIPWLGKVIVGTTDQKTDSPTAEPQATEEEIGFILSNAAKYLSKKPQRSDILSTFAGLRPLAAPAGSDGKTKEISRGHKVTIAPSGLTTVIGGKWTTFRAMGQDVIKKVSKHLGKDYATSTSTSIAIDITSLPSEKDLVHEELPYTWDAIQYVISHEQCETIEDVLSRRTRCLLLHRSATLQIAPKVAEMLAKHHGHDARWIASGLEEFNDVAKKYRCA